MTADEPEAEDVSSLFRKFGGDASGYKEFEPLEDNSAAAAGWALVPGKGPAAALPPEVPAAPLAPLQPAPPVMVPKQPSAAPAASTATAAARATPAATVAARAAAAPTAAAIPAPSPSAPFAPAAAPRELDLLFARLAGQDTGADSGHRLLSRWRRPS